LSPSNLSADTSSRGDGDRSGPDGGFALIAESDLPLVRDLNGEPGREELLDKLERRLTDAKAKPSGYPGRGERSRELLKQTTIIALRVRAGDDASCLNLHKPRTPRVLGVPSALIARGWVRVRRDGAACRKSLDAVERPRRTLRLFW
jgi:hypothetical protein